LFSTTSNEILVTSVDRKKVVTLNRPRALNALNLSMVRQFYSLLKKWNSERIASLVILKGAGDKAFCAGGDVIAVTKSAKANDPSLTVHKDFFREEYLLNHLIGVCEAPFISLLNGITMGGGCGVSIHGGFRVATEKTVLSMPETALGLFPDVGGSYFLSRLKHKLGIFLALTGYRLQGADVYHSGLATHYVPSQMLPALEKDLLQLKDEEVRAQTIRVKLKKYNEDDLPKFSLEPHLEEIEDLFTAPTMEGIVSNLKKSNSEFAQKQLRIISKMSPTSLKVTLRQLLEGAKINFSEVFTMEYRLSQRFMLDHDFHEGCRAILIEKDRKPLWQPSQLEDVTEEMVNKYFEPLPEGEDLLIKADTHK
uniref:3-hydroxyisobutyryl-CoA hydrolase, mitochondrial n=1 Tax=Enterobius vermicularis TaxID=51028 RepID=A0A0N4V1K4_ENTVE